MVDCTSLVVVVASAVGVTDERVEDEEIEVVVVIVFEWRIGEATIAGDTVALRNSGVSSKSISSSSARAQSVSLRETAMSCSRTTRFGVGEDIVCLFAIRDDES